MGSFDTFPQNLVLNRARPRLGYNGAVAYSDFTLDTLRARFGLVITFEMGTFAFSAPVAPSRELSDALRRELPQAVDGGTEKIRSEAIITPTLVELWQILAGRVSVFSGNEFNVDRKKGLSGFCDYLVSRSPALIAIEAPVVVLVEANKKTSTLERHNASQRWLPLNLLVRSVNNLCPSCLVACLPGQRGGFSSWRISTRQWTWPKCLLPMSLKSLVFFNTWRQYMATGEPPLDVIA